MVIQCSSCQTRFRLADEKVKPQGTRVRCSKCGQVFTVRPPVPVMDAEAPKTGAEESSAQSPALATAAETGERTGAWGNAVGSQSETESQPEESSSETVPAAAEPDGDTDDAGIRFEDEPSAAGSDDQFSFDSPMSATDDFSFEAETTGGDDGFSFDDQGGDDAGEFSFDTDEEAKADSAPLEFDAFSFDDGPATGGGAEEDRAVEFESDGGDELSFEEDDDKAFSFAGDDGEDAFSWGEPDGAVATPGQFDFGDAPEQEQTASDGFDFAPLPLSTEASHAAAAVPETTIAPAVSKPAMPAAAAQPAATSVEPVRGKHARPKRRGVGRFFTWLLILILLGLCGATGYFYWIGEFPDVNSLLKHFMPPAAPPATTSLIKVTDLNGFFLNNTEAGQLFVVQGKAVNNYPEPRSAMEVQAKLFNRDGKLLRTRTAYCGNSISEEELRSLSLTKLRERSDNQFGDSLSNLNVAPGKSVPFTIVFNDLPSDLAEFTVEPGDSIPGSKQ